MTDTPLTDDARTLLATLAERPVWEVADLRKRLGWTTARIVKARNELGWLNADKWLRTTHIDCMCLTDRGRELYEAGAAGEQLTLLEV